MLRPGLAWASTTDALYGRIDIPPLVQRLLQTAGVRRLDRLRQLPDLSISLPAATHTRLVHSLGVMHLATVMFDRLWQLQRIRSRWWKAAHLPEPTPGLRPLVQVAGVLHDVGHGPFSHAFEHILRRRYPHLGGIEQVQAERRILDADGRSGIGRILEESQLGDRTALQVSRVVRGLSPDLSKEHHFVAQIVNSELDADRLDYLPRDARLSGVGLGNVDPWGIIDRLTLARDAEGFVRLALPAEAEESALDVLFARARAYDRLYNSPAALCVQEMLLLAFDERFGSEEPLSRQRIDDLGWLTDESFLAEIAGESPLSKDLLERLRGNRPYVLLPVRLGDAEARCSEEVLRALRRWRTPLGAADIAAHRTAVKGVSSACLGGKGGADGPWRTILVLEAGKSGAAHVPSAPWVVDTPDAPPRPLRMPSARGGDGGERGPAGGHLAAHPDEDRRSKPVHIAVPEEWVLEDPTGRALLGDVTSVEEARRRIDARLADIGFVALYEAWGARLGGGVEIDRNGLLARTTDWLVRTLWAGR